jgi:hypothetical protein
MVAQFFLNFDKTNKVKIVCVNWPDWKSITQESHPPAVYYDQKLPPLKDTVYYFTEWSSICMHEGNSPRLSVSIIPGAKTWM